MKKKLILSLYCSIILFLAIPQLHAQSVVSRDSLISAAREIMKETTYCAFVTIDSTGRPQVRTMNPFPANDELIIWFGTSRNSAKVREIKNNPNVSVYYADHVNAKGYVTITGKAEVIDNKEVLMKMKRGYWDEIPNWKTIFVLIKIVPEKLEVINYKHGLVNDPNTFKAPSVIF
jgi:general stress protein 26